MTRFGKLALLSVLLATVVIWSGCSRDPERRATRFLADGERFYQKGDYARSVLQFKNAIQVQPARPESHYRLGLALLAEGDGTTAAAEFKKATDLNPNYIEAQLMLSNLMLASRNRDMISEAEKRMLQLVAVAPQNQDAWNALAMANWQLGRQEEAQRRFQEALEKFPANLQASISLARIKMGRGDIVGAESLLKNAVEQDPKAALPQIALAVFQTSRSDLAAAELSLHRALQLEPNNALALIELLGVQMRAGHIDQARATYTILAAAHGDRYRSLYASLLFDAGGRDEAIAEFERLTRENPSDRETRTWLVRAYLRIGRLPDARKILDDTLRRNPQDVDALMQRSILHLWAGAFTAAQDDVARVLHFRPDSAQPHYVLSKVYAARGAALTQRQELGQALQIDPQFLAARIDLSQALLAAGDSQGALDLVNQTPDFQKESLPAILARNWALIAAHDVEALRAGVAKALAKGESVDGLLQSAVLRLHEHDFAGARESVLKALTLNPDDVRALDLLTRGYLMENRPDEAARKLREYAADHRSSPGVQYIWAQWAGAHGDRRAARAALEESLQASPRYTPATLALASLDVAENKLDVARRRLQALVSEDNQNTPAGLMLADLDESAGDHAAALAHYRAVLATEPDNVLALNNVAYLLTDFANKPDEALPLVQRAKQLSPDSPAVEDTLGWVLYSKGLYASALPHLERAAADEGTDRRYYHLGLAYLKTGDRPRSRQALEQALQKNTRLPQADEARRLLEQLEPR